MIKSINLGYRFLIFSLLAIGLLIVSGVAFSQVVSAQSRVNAHSCFADDVCEVKSLSSYGNQSSNNPLQVISLLEAQEGIDSLGVITAPSIFVSSSLAGTQGGAISFLQSGLFFAAPSEKSIIFKVPSVNYGWMDQMKITPFGVAIGFTTNSGYNATERLDVNGNVKASNLISLGYAKINNMNGTGNAYACVDSQGKLFRKSSPCV